MLLNNCCLVRRMMYMVRISASSVISKVRGLSLNSPLWFTSNSKVVFDEVDIFGIRLNDKGLIALITSVSRLCASGTMYNSWLLSLRLYTVIDIPEEMLVGQYLPPYCISQLEDCIIISDGFKFIDFSIIYAWELQVDDGEVSCIHVEPSPLTQNSVTIIHGPPGIVQLSSSTRIEPSSSTSNPVRIIPGPAGLGQRAKLLKQNVFILDLDGALMSTQEYMQKFIEDVGEDADFNNGAWVSATNYVNAFGGTITGCLGDINNFLKKGKLEQVVAIVKSCSPNALGDLNVTLKDLSGTVPGTIHYKVLDVGSYGKDVTVGAAMILANVSVFTPKPSERYLNITKRNVVEVF
uniref:Homologous recombination OB-fold protein OB-fold domain-containing protein n=1 Tax=Tanacetum cinerariifolium TaxID=118510 RepID=A0A6L2KF52_TANCI|nr:hypothetical protein [Tanacetum cinerariifolium]